MARRAYRRKRKKKARIRRFIRAAVLILLCLLFFAVSFFLLRLLVSRLFGSSEETAGNTLEINKNGSITETQVEPFDPAEYDKEAFRTLVESEVKEYTDYKGDDDCVRLSGLSFEDGEVRLTIDYASAEDYASYNDKGLYCGPIKTLKEQGIEIEVTVTEAFGSSSMSGGEWIELKKRNVLVMNEDARVILPSKIRYASRNVSLNDKRTAVARSGEEDSVIIY